MSKKKLFNIDKNDLMFNNKVLFALLIPIVIEQLLNSFMGMVDTMMVSNLGSQAISGVSLVDSVNNLIVQLFSAMATGAAIICSHYIGMKDKKGANKAARQVVLTVAVIAIVITIIGLLFRRPILSFIFGKVEQDVMDNAVTYFLYTALSYPFLALFSAGSAIFRSCGNSRYPMVVSIISNLINVTGNAILMFGLNMGVAGGTEGSICPIGIAGFTALTALSSESDPKRCSLPFDKERSGFVMGEGAGIVVLEELEHAKQRGAKIYAEVAGYGCSSDAYHITSPAEDGAGAARAMENAMKDAGVKPDEIPYINAHGTATHLNDLFETRAIRLAFGEHATKLKINSTKSMIGHLLGAAGAVEFVTCVKEMQENYVHATVGYQTPDEELDLDYCREAVAMEVPYALSNSLGFGGHNASLLLKRYGGEA